MLSVLRLLLKDRIPFDEYHCRCHGELVLLLTVFGPRKIDLNGTTFSLACPFQARENRTLKQGRTRNRQYSEMEKTVHVLYD
jgi:hypothetical protein